MRCDSAKGEASVGRRAPREETTEEHGFDVADARLLVRRSHFVVQVLLDDVAVVRRHQKSHRRAAREGHFGTQRHVRADLGLLAHVARTAAEDAAGDLKIVPEVEPRVGVVAVVPEVEVGDEVGVENDEGAQVRIERVLVAERVFDLRVVADVHVELFEEGAIEADSPLELPVANHGVGGRRVGLDEQREDVELRANEPLGVRFEESRLLELQAKLLLRKELLGRRDVVDAGRVEDDAGLEVHGEVTKATEEVVVLPARDEVQLGLDLVELDAETEAHLAQFARLDVDGQRDDARLGVRQIRRDRHGRKDLQVKQRGRGRVDARGGEGLAGQDVDRAQERRLGDLLRARTGPVRIETLNGNGPERGGVAGSDGQRRMSQAVDDVDVRVALDGRVRVPDVRQRLARGALGLRALVLFERHGSRQHRAYGDPDGRLHPRGKLVDAFDHQIAVDRRRSFFHDDLHADVAIRARDDPTRARVRRVIPARPVVALDARQIPLEGRGVEDLVVVDDAAEDTEKLRALLGGELVLDVGLGDAVGAVDRNGVDGLLSGSDRRAPADERERKRRGRK